MIENGILKNPINDEEFMGFVRYHFKEFKKNNSDVNWEEFRAYIRPKIHNVEIYDRYPLSALKARFIRCKSEK